VDTVSKLSNGNYVGCKVLKISEFVSNKSLENENGISIAMKRLTSEFFRLSYPYQVCLELLLITEKAEKQLFRSNIGVYFVVRALDATEDKVSILIESAIKSIKNNLEECGYDTEEYENITESVLSNCYSQANSLYAVAKEEKSSHSISSREVHYYSEVLSADGIDLSSMLSRLSEMNNSIVSFQLFPYAFDMKERSAINTYLGRLEQYLSGYKVGNQLIKDSSAQAPYDYWGYYQEQMSNPLFTYNILISAPVESCGILANTMISLLQGGSNKSFSTISLPSTKYNLQNLFLIYPWNINNFLIYNAHNKNLLKTSFAAKALFKLPYIVTGDEAGCFFRPPVYEEAPALLVESKGNKNSAPLNELVTNDDNILLGKIQSNHGEEIGIGASPKAFTRHAVVVGMSGYGKTTYMIHLLLQFYEKGIPFLVVEPTKTEYRAIIDAIPELQIFTPGNSEISPLILNPFIPPRGITLEQYKPGLMTSFEAAFSMESPLTEIFQQAINDVYTEYNWKSNSKQGDKDVLPFGLHEFILTFKRIIRNSNYKADIKGNLEAAGTFRLIKLIEQNRSAYDVINTVPIEDLVSKPTIIELNAISNQEQKALLISLLLNNICLYTKNNFVGDGSLKNVMMIDEAHVLLDPNASGTNTSSSQITIKSIQNMIMEIRSYGTSIVIADQRPSQIGKDIIGNTEIKTSFKLIEPEERRLIAESTNMDEATEDELTTLSVGEAFVYYNMLDHPQRITNKDSRKEKGIRLSIPDDEIMRKMHYWDDKQQLLKPYGECDLCKYCTVCNRNLSNKATFFGSKYRLDYQKELSDAESLKARMYNIDHYIEKQDVKEDEKNQIIICSAIKFVREVQRNTDIELSKDVVESIIKKLEAKIEEK